MQQNWSRGKDASYLGPPLKRTNSCVYVTDDRVIYPK